MRLLAVDDGIWSGNLNFADIMFLVGFILFVLYVIVQFVKGVDGRIHGLLLGAGLGCIALGLLVL